MTNDKNKKNKRNKIEDSTVGREATSTPQPARCERGKVSRQAPGRIGRPKGTNSKPEKPGRVVAIGPDVPSLDDVLKGHEGTTEPAKGRGRPTDYRPEFVKVAGAMAMLGGTDFEIAEELGVKTSTIWRWRTKYQDFCSAIDQGRDAFDNRIERSLAQRAVGYSYHSEKVFCYEGAVIRSETVEHVPPDVGACRLWLMNRRPGQWRDRQEVKLDGSDVFLKLWAAISDGTAEKMLGN